MKTAFMFPGQGAQYAGMGRELYDNCNTFKEVFDTADSVLDFSVSELCFGTNERLNDTSFAQPCLLTHGYACAKVMNTFGVTPDFVLGLSLGEYSALASAGVFEFTEALKLVRQRGKYMLDAAMAGFGAMSAIMNLSAELTEKACREACLPGQTAICANYNMPGQLVISGEISAVERAEKLCLEYGAKRAIRLNVSGAFHSEYMKPAGDRLEAEFSKISVSPARIPVISNTDGKIIETPAAVVPTLLKQLISPVRWIDCIETAIANGVGTFIELGPGKTLCSFVRKINKDVKTFNVEDIKSLESVLSAVKENTL